MQFLTFLTVWRNKLSAEFIEHRIIRNSDFLLIKRRYLYLFLKKTLDISISLIGLIILFPLFIVVSILIKLDSKGPIIYRQIRVGKNFKYFYIFKFRTMIKNADNNGGFITPTNDKRITRIGHFLRKFKIDELPQLVNVFIGDMSIVGPRPEVPEYTFKNSEYNRVLSIKPGITDYASIKYRNEDKLLFNAELAGNSISKFYINNILPEQIKLNTKYIEKMSIFTDIFIILQTIFYVFIVSL